MISSQHRFTRREFSLLRPKMKKFSAGDFLFFHCPFKNHSKLAAVISKKVDKKAVNRNAWRRSVYRLVGTDLLRSETALALVCLYKGPSIPENDQDLAQAWKSFKRYAEEKQLLKFN